MPTLTQEQIAALRKQLRARHEELRRQISDELLRADEEQYTDLAGMVSDTGEQSVADLLVDLNNARIDQQVQEVRRIEAALQRIAEVNYGVCEECGTDIDYERLKVQPTALRCIDCQRRYEQNYAQERRPSTL